MWNWWRPWRWGCLSSLSWWVILKRVHLSRFQVDLHISVSGHNTPRVSSSFTDRLTPPVLSLLQAFSVLNLVSTWIFMFVSAKRRVQKAMEHLSGMACARGGQGLVHRWRDGCWAPLYGLTSVAVFGSRNTHTSTHYRREERTLSWSVLFQSLPRNSKQSRFHFTLKKAFFFGQELLIVTKLALLLMLQVGILWQ